MGSGPCPLSIHPPGAVHGGQSPRCLPPQLCPSAPVRQPWGTQARAGQWVTHCRGWPSAAWTVLVTGKPGGHWEPRAHPGAQPSGDKEPGGDTNAVCLLAAGPEAFPTMPLGLEQVSLMPRSLLLPPSIQTLPRVEGLTSQAQPPSVSSRAPFQLGHPPGPGAAAEGNIRGARGCVPAAWSPRGSGSGLAAPTQDPSLVQLTPE